MDIFFKITSLLIVSSILTLFLGKWEKNIALLLAITACCVALASAICYLRPVLTFLSQLEAMSSLENGMLTTLIKAVGILFIAEIAGMICSDAGNGSLAKTIQWIGSCTVLYLSIPIFQSIITILRDILGEL